MTGTVLIVGPSFGSCNVLPSPAVRLAGYGSHLREYGWRVVLVSEACRCLPVRRLRQGDTLATDDGQIVFDPADASSTADAFSRPTAGDVPLTVYRPVLRPPRALIRWAALAARSGMDLDDRYAYLGWHVFPSFQGPPPSSESRQTVTGFARRALSAYLRLWAYEEARARQLAAVAERAAGSARAVDVVMGSHVFAGHLFAAHRVARNLRVPLVAEFRDAVLQGWHPAAEKLELLRVARTVRSAKAILHVSAAEQRRDSAWLPKHALLRVVESGFDSAEWDRIRAESDRDESHFVVRFAGTLHPKRHIGLALQGFAQLLKEFGPEERRRISFEYLGRSDSMAEALWRAIGPDPSFSDNFVVGGLVSRAEALRRMASSDVLVLPMADQDGLPGGRLYEYLGSRRPILAVGHREDPHVADVLSRTRSGVVATSVEGVASILGGWLRDPRTRPVPDETALKGYTRKRQASELAEILERVRRA